MLRIYDQPSPAEEYCIQESVERNKRENAKNIHIAGEQEQEQYDSSDPELEQQVRSQLCHRITAAYRYTPEAVTEALKDAVEGWRGKIHKTAG